MQLAINFTVQGCLFWYALCVGVCRVFLGEGYVLQCMRREFILTATLLHNRLWDQVGSPTHLKFPWRKICKIPLVPTKQPVLSPSLSHILRPEQQQDRIPYHGWVTPVCAFIAIQAVQVQYSEGLAKVWVSQQLANAPGSVSGFLNPKMRINRDLVVRSLFVDTQRCLWWECATARWNSQHQSNMLVSS